MIPEPKGDAGDALCVLDAPGKLPSVLLAWLNYPLHQVYERVVSRSGLDRHYGS